MSPATHRGLRLRVDYLAEMRRLPLCSLLLAGSSLVLLGCGSDAKSATDSSVPTTAGPAATSAATGATAAGGECGADVVAKVTAQVKSDAVTKIKIIGGCSLVNITTSLANDGISAALDMCDQAAEVAYVGNVSGISVQASSGKEIALGVKGSPCIGAP